MINVEMRLVPPLGGVPLGVVQNVVEPTRKRSAAAAAAQLIKNIVFSAKKKVAPPPEASWEIPSSNENVILKHCV